MFLSKCKAFIKLIISAFLAFLILNIFCFFYSNVPSHHVSQNGATDYTRTPNTFYSRWTEGGGFGITNNEGFYNTFDYTDDTEIDILLMGSSQFEGSYVLPEQTISFQLNERLPDKTVYNLGMASHQFLNCTNNLEAALDTYHPEYAVIHTSVVYFNDDQLISSIQGNYPEIRSYSSGIIHTIESIPYCRLLFINWIDALGDYHFWSKFDDFFDIFKRKNPVQGPTPSTEQTGSNSELLNTSSSDEHLQTSDSNGNNELKKLSNEQLLDKYLHQMTSTADSYGAKLIIVYDPSTNISSDGKLFFSDDYWRVANFSELCNKNGITFLSMRDRYLKEYSESYSLPHGFTNSSVASGHLNKHGNLMIADELYKIISEVK